MESGRRYGVRFWLIALAAALILGTGATAVLAANNKMKGAVTTALAGTSGS